MMKININSIKSRIVLCFITMFILLAVVLSYYYLSFQQSENEQKQLLFNQLSSEMLQQTDERIFTIEQVAKSTGYYSVIQKVLFSISANTKVQNLKSSRELLATNKTAYPFIVDIFLYVDSKTHLYTDTVYAYEFRKNLSYFNFDTDIALDDPFITNIYAGSYTSPLFFYYLPISNIMYDGTFIAGGNDGLCIFLCDMDDLYIIPEGMDPDLITLALICNDEIISVSREITPDFADVLLNISSEQESFSYNEEKYFSQISANHENIRVVCTIPESSIVPDSYYEQNIMYMIIIVGTLIIVIFLAFNTQNISSSVRTILRELDNLQLGANDIRLSEPKLKEFSILTKQINVMLDRLDNSAKDEKLTREKLYEADLLQQKTEMIAYRNQINPHFLFNTMECVRSMAQYYEAEPIEQIITSMSKMFRYSLYAESTVPLSLEIDHVRQYMTVTNIRFPGLYELKIHSDAEADAFQLPSMLLQPLIENSVKHAFTNVQKKQHIIQLQAWVDDDSLLHIRITDNGCGMTESELSTLKIQNHMPEDGIKKDSIGIQNIYRRIKLLDSRNKIKFSSKYGFYTKIELMLYPVP